MEKGRNSGKMEKNHEIIDHLIRKARAEKASDIHISEGMPIWQRVNGHLQKSDWQMEPEQHKEKHFTREEMWISHGRLLTDADSV